MPKMEKRSELLAVVKSPRRESPVSQLPQNSCFIIAVGEIITPGPKCAVIASRS